ncbi:bifunctional NADH-specific enoyl-ACP reductase/trans-2-enoyl-CoA reductase, partial [Aquimarina litoralis]|nr:bifunctional NADH-specific enoyl-ACP reductase/trans-2-enoyl-CoA reductase [Aquimarina litoralis]
LYISLLYKIMKENNVHEGCIEQMQRLFSERLYSDVPATTDAEGRIRVDDWEMREDIQTQIKELWDSATTETLGSIGDLEGYNTDFFNLFGFKVDGVDYDEDVNEIVEIPGLQN